MENELSSLLQKGRTDISAAKTDTQLVSLHLSLFGRSGIFTKRAKKITALPVSERPAMGSHLNAIKKALLDEIERKRYTLQQQAEDEAMDVTIPAIPPPIGHLHLVTQAISEITHVFERIGFTRVRHPEVDWDWYAFESLNMPPNHPARDEWETFFISPPSGVKEVQTPGIKKKSIVLTPHTSNGQVREMEKGKLPIRMINIAKCYRRQSDISHVPMFHQFEGLYIDKNVAIAHLKGVLDYFVKQYYGPERQARIRPFHFQFTEPSFEVDISCGVCLSRGCKLCKGGWLELGGAGMIHPAVLTNGRVDPNQWNGFAFGWGVERVAMMKSGTKLDDVRLLYSNDIRFLEQF